MTEVFSSLSTSPESPMDFHEELFSKIAVEEIAFMDDPLKKIFLDESVEISHALKISQLQDGWSYRSVHLARLLALQLIDEKGELVTDRLNRSIELLKDTLFSLGIDRQDDFSSRLHILNILQQLKENQKLALELKRISKPYSHGVAERLIRESLLLKEGVIVTDAHAKQAALSGLLTLLRQNVGSCFATAPAILIQQQQPIRFLVDIGLLLSTGRLMRVQGGVESAVPLSSSWGVGDLYRPIQIATLGKNPWEALANSPGLLAAFQAAGILPTSNLQKKDLETFFLKALPEEVLANPFFIFTADQLIQMILLRHFEITLEDVEQFQLRPLEGVVGDVLLHIPHARHGKPASCSRYLKSYELAKNAFKALTEHPLLKAWEYTLASLSEIKADCASWNFYASLGLQPEQPFGVGECIQTFLQKKIDQINSEITHYQSQSDHVFAQLKSLEGRVNRAGNERDLGWLQAEYQSRRFEYHRLQAEAEEFHDKGRKFAQFFSFVLNFYHEKFKDYFQEVYDADMREIIGSLYDDSPAGFRLLFKHGRTNTTLWTLIRTPSEFIHALTSFFVSTEIELIQFPQTKGIQEEISQLVTAIVMLIKRPEFLESSLIRLAKAYGESLPANPLEHLEKIKRKPWAYISGGTMATLIRSYFSIDSPIKEKAQWVENEWELLAFFLDCLKELPLSIQKEFQRDQNHSLLAFSPTHAFLFKPGWTPFKKGWESSAYTYTWVRDHWMVPQQHFLFSQVLDHRMMDYLVEKIAQRIPSGYRSVFQNLFRSFTYPMNPIEFRSYLIGTLAYEKWLQEGGRLDFLSDEIDKCLYVCLPLFQEYELKEKLLLIFEALPGIEASLHPILHQLIDQTCEAIGRYRILSSDDLRHITHSILLALLGKTKTATPFAERITSALQNLQMAYPAPILCADTNWVNHSFGFIVSPGTGQLAFWRFNESGTIGTPMSAWKQYLNGSTRQEWGLYMNPYQYR